MKLLNYIKSAIWFKFISFFWSKESFFALIKSLFISFFILAFSSCIALFIYKYIPIELFIFIAYITLVIYIYFISDAHREEASTLYPIEYLDDNFDEKKKNNLIIKNKLNHYTQILELIFIALIPFLWIILFFGHKEANTNFLPFGIIATLLTWIFQDAIKGVIAYFHLHKNGLLHLGDWIQVPSHNIDGIISKISLVTVTVTNWDTTTSNIAICNLQTGAFCNLQKMLDKETYGRRMYRSFIIDSRSIYTLDKSQASELNKANLFAQEGELNISCYRKYLKIWLRNCGKITEKPRLVVRILDPTPEGIPVQIYTFLKKTNLEGFEAEQSEITEHAIKSLHSFGLKLYQRPSGQDLSKYINSFNDQDNENIKIDCQLS